MALPATIAWVAAFAYAVSTISLLANSTWRRADPNIYWPGLLWSTTWTLAFGLAAVSL